MIEVKNLSKEYDNPVLEDLNFTIPDGAIFGLIGVNGAGKTTLLNMLSGVMEQDFGQILYDNEPIFENVNRKKEIFYLPDDPFFTVSTTPKNLISIYKVFYKIDVKKYYEYLKEFNLDKNKSMFNFSKGMKRQVFVALALAIKPKYLFLDESFDGLDPMARMIFKSFSLLYILKSNWERVRYSTLILLCQRIFYILKKFLKKLALRC